MAERGAQPWALVAHAGEVEVDERARLADAFRELAEFHRQWELLATCHRVELYGFGPRPEGLDLRLLEGEEAVRHLFRVAAGLESAVIGETEILGQVRDALAHVRARNADERIGRLFECAIAAGRSARAAPLPARDGLAERAVAWLGGRMPLAGSQVLVVGTGEMGTALVAAARAAGATVTMATRRERSDAIGLADAACRATGVAAIAVALRGEWAELGDASTGDRLPPLADLSAPSAVPAPVRDALGADFLGIDDLWERARGGADEAWVAGAEAAVTQGVADYVGWLGGRHSIPTLVALRDRGESRRQARVERLLRRLPDLDDRARELVVAMSRQLVTDLMHEPVAALRSDPDGRRAEAARMLFDL